MTFEKNGIVWVATSNAQADAFIADGYIEVKEVKVTEVTEVTENVESEVKKAVGRKPIKK